MSMHQTQFAPRRDRLGAEHTGLARLFRNAVLREEMEWRPGALKIIQSIQRRLAQKPTLRKQSVVDLMRLWTALPAKYRMSLDFDDDGAGRLTIREIATASSAIQFQNWSPSPEWEPGVSLLRTVVTTDRFARFDAFPFVIISLHALARWFERSGSRDHELLMRDLRSLIDTDPTTDRVPTGYGGEWLGDPQVHCYAFNRKFSVRAVRTFVTTEQGPRRRRVLLPSTVPTGATAFAIHETAGVHH